MYRSGDVLAHFKGVCVFLEIAVQHASRQKEETIYCPYIVCKNHVVHSAITAVGPRCPAIIAAPGNYAVLLTVLL
jgi:hypothetical protein